MENLEEKEKKKRKERVHKKKIWRDLGEIPSGGKELWYGRAVFRAGKKKMGGLNKYGWKLCPFFGVKRNI